MSLLEVASDEVLRFAKSVPYVCIRDAKVQRFEPVGSSLFVGGPVLLEKEHQIFRHWHGKKAVDRFRSDERYEEYLRGDYTYAGGLYAHFGHFMAEMTHRIIPAQAIGLNFKYVFVVVQRGPKLTSFGELPRFIKDVLSYFGIRQDDIVIINRDTIVERLHIVPQASTLGRRPRPGYLKVLRSYSSARLNERFESVARPRLLYVSRSALQKQGSFLGESYIEHQLERTGFTIFRPEAHNIIEQMDHYRKAELVVFPSGSACHGVELLGSKMLNKVHVFPRTPDHNYFIEEILKPRAKNCLMTDVSQYVGTLTQEQDGVLSHYAGISTFRLKKLKLWSEDLKSNLPIKFSTFSYAKSSLFDLFQFYREASASSARRGVRADIEVLVRFIVLSLSVAWRQRALATSPETSIKHGRVAARTLTETELGAALIAVKCLPYPAGPLFYYMLLTLQPINVVLDARWSDMSVDLRTWTIPSERTKAGVSRAVHVTEVARRLLQTIPRSANVDFIFHDREKPVSGISKLLKTLRAEISRARLTNVGWADRETEAVPELSINDIRRAASLRLRELGYEPIAVQQMMSVDAQPPESAGQHSYETSFGASAPDLMLDDWSREVERMLGEAFKS